MEDRQGALHVRKQIEAEPAWTADQAIDFQGGTDGINR